MNAALANSNYHLISEKNDQKRTTPLNDIVAIKNHVPLLKKAGWNPTSIEKYDADLRKYIVDESAMKQVFGNGEAKKKATPAADPEMILAAKSFEQFAHRFAVGRVFNGETRQNLVDECRNLFLQVGGDIEEWNEITSQEFAEEEEEEEEEK